MASTVRMLAAGLALAADTFALIIFALTGSAIFTPISKWYASITGWHASLNPQMIQWIFPGFYVMLVILEVILIYAVYQAIFSKKTYYTDQGY